MNDTDGYRRRGTMKNLKQDWQRIKLPMRLVDAELKSCCCEASLILPCKSFHIGISISNPHPFASFAVDVT
jgi:hypothetical protein